MTEETNVTTLNTGNKLANLVNNPEVAKKAVEAARENAMAVAGAANMGIPLVKMDQKDGSWEIGRQKIPAGTKFAIDPTGLMRGIMVWKGGFPVDEVFVGVFDGQPPTDIDASQHEPFKGAMEGKKTSIAFSVQAVGSPLSGRYSSDSGGGMKMFSALLDEVVEAVNAGDGVVVPIVEFTSDSYTSKTYSKEIYNPIAKIVGWSDIGGNIHMNDGVVETADALA